MQTYLIISENREFIDRTIDKLREPLSVSDINCHIIKPDPSIGIDQVRNIVSIISNKTFSGGDRFIVIEDMEKATPEASNAMLKLLEEPPKSTYLVLTADNINKILPTIVSRCFVINDPSSGTPLSRREEENMAGFIRELLYSSPGQRIRISLSYSKSKEETESLIDGMLSFFHKLLNVRQTEKMPALLSDIQVAEIITKLIGAKRYLAKNVNYKATLDILFLGFPHLSPNLVK